MHVYSPRLGADNPLVTKFWRQQKAQITLTICCKFQNDLFEFWFYTHFLIILYMYIALGQGQTNPWGQNFNVNRKLLPLQPFVASLKKISLNSDLIHIFLQVVFPHVYSPGAGADNPLWTKFWCQQKGLVTLPICCKFQKNIFEVLILYIFLPVFIHYIAPGQGQTTPWGQNFYFNINLLSLWSFAVSFFHSMTF